MTEAQQPPQEETVASPRKQEKYAKDLASREAAREQARKDAKEVLNKRWTGLMDKGSKLGGAITSGLDRFGKYVGKKAQETWQAGVDASNAAVETAGPVARVVGNELARPLVWVGKVEQKIIAGADNATNTMAANIEDRKENKAVALEAKQQEYDATAAKAVEDANNNTADMVRLGQQRLEGGKVNITELQFKIDSIKKAEEAAKKAKDDADAAKKKAAGHRDAKNISHRVAGTLKNFLR